AGSGGGASVARGAAGSPPDGPELRRRVRQHRDRAVCRAKTGRGRGSLPEGGRRRSDFGDRPSLPRARPRSHEGDGRGFARPERGDQGEPERGGGVPSPGHYPRGTREVRRSAECLPARSRVGKERRPQPAAAVGRSTAGGGAARGPRSARGRNPVRGRAANEREGSGRAGWLLSPAPATGPRQRPSSLAGRVRGRSEHRAAESLPGGRVRPTSSRGRGPRAAFGGGRVGRATA